MAALTPEQVQAFAARRLGLTQERDTQTRRIGEDFTLNQNLVNDQANRDITNVGHQLSSQGLYNSGIRINEQGQVQQSANQAHSQLASSRTRALDDVNTGYTVGLSGLAAEEAAALAAQTREEQRQAEERARNQAIAQAGATGPPAYPSPIIGLSGNQQNAQQQTQNLINQNYLAAPGGQGYGSWGAFAQINPDLANLMMFFSGGNQEAAQSEAVRLGYVNQQIPIARGGSVGRM